MPKTIPIRDLKDTSKVVRLCHESPEPITVTRNGYEEMVLVKPEDFREMERARQKQRIYDMVAEAEEDIAAEKTREATSFFDELWKRHGL